MNSKTINKLQEEIKKNRKDREKQIKFFVPLARDIIQYVMLSDKTTKKDILQFFRIFNARGNYETIKIAIKKINAPENKKKEWLSQIDVMEKEKVFGFTGSARMVLKDFGRGHLRKLKQVFLKIMDIPETYSKLDEFAEAVKHLYDLPSLKNELSVWLNYIKPSIFPIISGSGKDMFSDLGYDTSFSQYHELIKCVPQITREVDETNFGMIDGASWTWSDKVQYWAGGFHWYRSGSEVSQFDDFISKGYWRIGWDKSNKKGKPFYNLVEMVNVGDYIALKSIGGKHDLKISAIGRVTDNSKKSEGKLDIKWIKIGNIYHGKAPKGSGAGNWRGTFVPVKRKEDITLIFGDFSKDGGIISEKNNKAKILSKNTILYGPPGTGKTFITKQKAVEVIEND